MLNLNDWGELFTAEERRYLPARMQGGRLNRLHCGLWVELSPSRHDLSLAELNSTAVGTSVGLRRITQGPQRWPSLAPRADT